MEKPSRHHGRGWRLCYKASGGETPRPAQDPSTQPGLLGAGFRLLGGGGAVLFRLDLLTQPWPLDHKRPLRSLGKQAASAQPRLPSEPWGRVFGVCGCSSLMSSGSRIIQGTEVSRLLARQTGCCSHPEHGGLRSRVEGGQQNPAQLSFSSKTGEVRQLHCLWFLALRGCL